MDSIKYFDFFGGKFHFYTNNQPSYRNIFGGIMYLIYIILCLLIFIICSYDDLVRLGSEKAVKEAGLMRTEGKDYVMRDGDVVEFKFNV